MTRLQSISVITLGSDDLTSTRRFYGEGFGWAPVFEQPDILFFQMNGLMLGIWDRAALAADCSYAPAIKAGAMSIAHNVLTADAVEPLIERLVAAGGTLLRAADAPPYGGLRGYVADPDGHVWEIAFNPAWPMDDEGRVKFGV